MVDEGERMPIRLVQENGDTISLDATSVDIVVERTQSNFGIPFYDAKKMGIDLNQASVNIEIQGVLADDDGQEQTAQATATLDFYQPQQIVSWGQPINPGSGGVNTGPVASGFNMTGSTAGVAAGVTGIASGIGFGGSYGGGMGGSLGGGVTDFKDLGNRILRYWHEKYIDLPIGYKVEQREVQLQNPVQTNLQIWLKGDTLASTLNTGDSVSSWTESSNGRTATQGTSAAQPTFNKEENSVVFDGTNDFLSIPFSPFANSEEFTIFVVAKTDDNSGDQPIVSSIQGTTVGGDAAGYALFFDRTNEHAEAYWHEGSTIEQKDTSGSGNVDVKNDKYILGYIMRDTDADSQSDEVTVSLNGNIRNNQTITGVGYVPATSATLNIGKEGSSFFKGHIYEVLIYNSDLTTDDRELVEGYLSRKYNVTLSNSHPYRNFLYSGDVLHLRVGFDKEMVGSVQEPYGFLNRNRPTQLSIAPPTGAGATVITVTGDPREYFELSETNRPYVIEFREPTGALRQTSGNRLYTGTVTAVTANTITVSLSRSGATHNVGDFIYIKAVNYTTPELRGSRNIPRLIIPVKNADVFNDKADPEKAVGPEFPPHENGAVRDDGNGIKRTDEYITYLISKAITSSAIDIGLSVNSSNEKTLDKAFSTSIGQSYHGFNTRLTITQVYPSSLGQLSESINTSLGVGQMPVTQGFSGGRSGKRVKSGGDKVQDLLGILANSNNYTTNPDVNAVGDALDLAVGFLTNQVNSPDAQGDYIHGIQIPYNSLATKGKNSLDSDVAQRNFFVTTEGNTADKLATANTVHASRTFARHMEGHMKNGISGLVTDFYFARDAEMKAYDFTLTFTAADIIL